MLAQVFHFFLQWIKGFYNLKIGKRMALEAFLVNRYDNQLRRENVGLRADLKEMMLGLSV